MDKIALIKAEIERLKAKYRKDMYKSNYEGLASGYKIEAYNELLSFLDTLSEEPDKSLEEAADNHIRKVVDAAGHPGWDWTTQDISEAFIAGAKWQKQQMIEEAIEGEVYKYDKLFYVRERKSKSLTEALTKFNDGDKVKIIIVKEE